MAAETTTDRLHQMKLSTMARAYRGQMEDRELSDLSFDERFAMLVDAEFDARRLNRRTRLLRSAGFSCPQANIKNIRYDADRAIDRELITTLSTCAYILDAENVVLTGSTGAGKSWLACALGVAACYQFYSVRYIRLPDLLDELALSHHLDTYRKLRKRYSICDVLILDDWLLSPLSDTQAREVLEVIESRYARKSTILCSQFSPAGWHTRLSEGAIADAVIDRLVHNAYMVHVEGNESMRKRTSNIG